MKFLDGSYRVVAAPFSGANSPPAVKVDVKRERVSLLAWVEDIPLKFNGNTRGLSEAFLVQFRPFQSVMFPGGGNWFGPDVKVSGLDGVLGALERQEPNFEPSTATEILVGEAVDSDTVVCTVVARRSERPVSRLSRLLFAEDAERPTIEALSKRQFIRPHRSESPVMSFRMLIPPGNPIGETPNPMVAAKLPGRIGGQEGSRDGAPVFDFGSFTPTVTLSNTGARGASNITLPTGWHLDFEAGWDQYMHEGAYTVAASNPTNFRDPLPRVTAFRDFVTPKTLANYPGQVRMIEVPFNPNIIRHDAGKLCYIDFSGQFRVWEFEERGRDGKPHLALDFVLRGKPKQPGGPDLPPVVGMVRVNSRYN